VDDATAILVEELGGDGFRVNVGSLEYRVTATAAVIARVARVGESPGATVRRAFEFLLEREPPSSILRRFALEDIANYFPEFWSAMG
jgi:hypothetical protein